jgi:hypothetical protein
MAYGSVLEGVFWESHTCCNLLSILDSLEHPMLIGIKVESSHYSTFLLWKVIK